MSHAVFLYTLSREQRINYKSMKKILAFFFLTYVSCSPSQDSDKIQKQLNAIEEQLEELQKRDSIREIKRKGEIDSLLKLFSQKAKCKYIISAKNFADAVLQLPLPEDTRADYYAVNLLRQVSKQELESDAVMFKRQQIKQYLTKEKHYYQIAKDYLTESTKKDIGITILEGISKGLDELTKLEMEYYFISEYEDDYDNYMAKLRAWVINHQLWNMRVKGKAKKVKEKSIKYEKLYCI